MYDLKLEELVLGTLMSDRNAINEVRTLLTSNMFYSSYHQSLYLAMMEIDKRGERIDVISVATELKKTGDVDYYKLSGVSNNNTFDIYQHAAVIHDLYKRRSLLELSIRVQSDVKDLSLDIFDIVKDTSDALDGFFDVTDEGVSTINDAIEGVRKQMEQNAISHGEITGTPTGFKEFDKKSGGLQKSDLVIIAAESSQGKTSLAMTITLNAALRGSKVAVYSMEMRKEQIAARLMSVQSGVPANEILYSKLDHIQFDMIDRGIGTLYDKGIYFDDRSTSNIDTILNSIRSLKMKYDIDGVVIDYLQILNVNMKGASKEQQMGDVARRLKNVAKDLDIWVMALSQLSRDKDNPVPSVARLRDSGQINEAADTTILIYRPELYGKTYPDDFSQKETKGTAMIDIGKGRNIGIFKFICGFDSKTTKFYDLDEVPQYREPDAPF